MKHTVTLPRIGAWPAWRDAARRFGSNGIAPDEVNWQTQGNAAGLFDRPDATLPAAGPYPLTVPRSFLPMAEQVVCSRAPGAHDLLYRLLLRASSDARVLSNRADPQVQKVAEMAKNIRRDRHKMRAFVRFREVTDAHAPRRSFVAWFEPDHRIEELNAPFFARRFADMDWVIVTPEVTTRFIYGDLNFEAVSSDAPDLTDETEALWKTYYANTFNPARLKIKAMTAEMPRKYWKNMPETALIPEMIAKAETRAQQMRAAAPTQAPARAGRILDTLPDHSREQGEAALAGLQCCTRCPLAQMATQAVPGAGPVNAALMIVGEQPGDNEDLAGAPFIGPAGQLFDQIAEEAGLDRAAAYVTNAVKHFKFQARGKRRIHQSPSASEIQQCRWWLSREISQVRPALILALGATAAQALTGDGKQILKRRGTLEPGLDGIPVFIALHPAALLRAPDRATEIARTTQMRADLAQVAAMLADLETESRDLRKNGPPRPAARC